MSASDEDFLRELTQSMAGHATTMHAAADANYGNETTLRDHVVRSLLRRCAEFARAGVDLGKSENPTALALIARAILENMICLLWVVISEENANEHERAAIAELTRAARINFEKGNARIRNRHTGEDATAELLEQDQFKNLPRRRSVEDQAKAAGVQPLYDIFYRFFSVETHGYGAMGKDKDNPLRLTHMNMQGIGALCVASGHVGVRWLLHRQRTENKVLHQLMGLARDA